MHLGLERPPMDDDRQRDAPSLAALLDGECPSAREIAAWVMGSD